MKKLKNKTILVTGITRSGLSLTMQILDRGGYPCVGEYPGFEKYKVGEIPFKKYLGHAIKIVDLHLQIPPSGVYSVIRLKRNLDQQAKSFIKFGKLFGVLPDRDYSIEIINSFQEDYKTIDAWIGKQNESITIDFEELILNSKQTISKIEQFIDQELSGSEQVIIKRSPNCYSGMLELQLIDTGI